jgi:hypothetical protein
MDLSFWIFLPSTNYILLQSLPTPIVLKPGPAWWVDPGLELGRVEEKIEKEKTRCDSVATR